MDPQTARTLLANMVAASSRPALLDADLDALLVRFSRTDSQGRAPTDNAWSGDYNLNAAAAEGWRWKAGKVAGDYSFSADDASYSKGDVIAHCEAMVAQYAALDHGDVETMGAGDYPVRRLFP